MKAKLFAVAYLVFMVTLAYKDVGTVSCTEPYIVEWYLPLVIGMIIIIPYVLGYISAKEDE